MMKVISLLTCSLLCFQLHAQLADYHKKTGVLFPIKNHAINKFGFIDSTGKLTGPFKYDYADAFDNGLAYVRENGVSYYINPKLEKVADDGYLLYENGFARFQKDSKSGLVDNNGMVVVQPIYDKVWGFSEGFAGVQLGNKHGYVDKKGKVIIPIIYDEAYDFDNGLAVVKANGKYGYINQKGVIVVPPEYDDARDYSGGLFSVCKDGGCGFVDINNKKVVDFMYEETGRFREGLAAVKMSGKWGYINKAAQVVIPFQYDEVASFSSGLAGIKKDGKWGFIEKSGKVVIEAQFDEIKESFIDGMAKVKINDTRCVINKEGEIICNDCYDLTFHNIYNGEPYQIALATIKNSNGTYLRGYVNKNGTLLIPHQYESGSDFNYGMAAVKISNGRYIFIDSTGRNVFGQQFLQAGGFYYGLAPVRLESGQNTYIDTKGNLWKQAYESSGSFAFGHAKVRQGGYDCIIDRSGHILVKTKGTLTESYVNGMAEMYYKRDDNVSTADVLFQSLTGEDRGAVNGYIMRDGKEIFFAK